MQKFLRFVSYLGLIFCLINCHADDKKQLYDVSKDDEIIRMLEDSLNYHPAKTDDQVDFFLEKVRDSLSYYRLLVVKAKAKMISAEIDSSVAILQRIESFCSSASLSERGRSLLLANVHNMRETFMLVGL